MGPFMADKLEIDTNGAPDGKYGPFYVMCDVYVQGRRAIPALSEDARVDDHIYRFVEEEVEGVKVWRMRLTKSIIVSANTEEKSSGQ